MLVGAVYCPDTFLHVSLCFLSVTMALALPKAETGNQERSFLPYVVPSATVELTIARRYTSPCTTWLPLVSDSETHTCPAPHLIWLSPLLWCLPKILSRHLTESPQSCSRLRLGARELQVSTCHSSSIPHSSPAALCSLGWCGRSLLPWPLNSVLHLIPLTDPYLFKVSVFLHILFKYLNNSPSSFDRVRIHQYSAQIKIRDEVYISNFIQEALFF